MFQEKESSRALLTSKERNYFQTYLISKLKLKGCGKKQTPLRCFYTCLINEDLLQRTQL